jgi:O-antigen ligase
MHNFQMKNKYMLMAIYASLMCLGLGLFTSMTFLALNHIFIIIPCLYFLPRTNFKEWSMSAWFLLAMIIAIILSVLVNQDIAVAGYAPLTKSKYYLIALLSIAPMSFYFKNLSGESDHDKKIKWLLWAFIGTTTLATLSGMGGVFFGYNLLKLKAGFVNRNGGLAGMLMNYAHNLAMFQVILTGLILYRKEMKRYLNLNFLYATWLINFLGLYLTYTRGALLGFLVALPFFFFKKNLKSFVISSLITIIIGVGGYKLAGKSIERTLSDVQRVSQWKAAFAGFKERPVFGLGYLNFEKLSTSLKVKYNIEEVTFGGHAHSNYFEMLASTGAIGFLFFMLWQICWFVEMMKRDDLIGNIALPFIVVFVVAGLTQATFTLGANLFFIMPAYALTQINFKLLKINKEG